MDKKTKLLKQSRKVFSTDDLALIWGIIKRGTLLTTINRYTRSQTLYKIRKGLYSVVPVDELDPYLLGTSYISGFCYVSMQTVLAREGLINQSPNIITLVGKRSMNFSFGGNDYICRKMNEKYLNNIVGIDLHGDYPIAQIERAIADALYFNKNFYFDGNIEKYLLAVNKILKEVYNENPKTI